MIKSYKDKTPRIHPSAFVEESAYVIGDVEIGEGSGIWFGCVLRGDVHYIKIGRMTNIQDLSVLHVTKSRHSLEIGDEVTVGHRAILHGCRVSSRCMIGMGAIILDGAEIGEFSIIGAGSVVTEKTVIPGGSLALGIPARVIRTLNNEEKERIIESAKSYRTLIEDYIKR